jgi:hypothetical protein
MNSNDYESDDDSSWNDDDVIALDEEEIQTAQAEDNERNGREERHTSVRIFAGKYKIKRKIISNVNYFDFFSNHQSWWFFDSYLYLSMVLSTSMARSSFHL